MKSLVVWTATLVWLAVNSSMANASPAGCPANLPAGTIIRIFSNEKLTAGVTSGPIVFSVGSDVRSLPNHQPLLSKGSKVLGEVVESQQAGRLWGKARSHIVLTSILTPDSCEYPIDAKIIEAGAFNVADNVVWGRGHAERDALLLLFPPTTLYQVLRIPSRGPNLVLDKETPITIKLMQPLYAEQALSSSSDNEISTLHAKIDQLERDISNLEAAAGYRASASPGGGLRPLVSAPCPAPAAIPPAPPTVYKDTVLRPVWNSTPYHVRLYLNGAPMALLPPCHSSMVLMPTYAFRLESVASLLTTEGQTQVELKVVPNIDRTGWDIVWDRNQPVPISRNR
jgi:hypothetical protein